jgi:HNH endonuclease
MTELNDILVDIQDRLVPILDTYEQAIYHYIFRHTYLINEKTTLFRTKSAEIGFGSGALETAVSEKSRSKKLRGLAAKGAVKIVDRSNRGILVEIVLPKDILGLQNPVLEEEIDLESLDFYRDRRLLPVILEREGHRCFYTGRKLTEDNCYLDHVVPQSDGGNNGYKNIVAASYDANSLKSNKNVTDFVRLLYKDGLISLSEFHELTTKITSLQNGELKPNAVQVRRAWYGEILSLGEH